MIGEARTFEEYKGAGVFADLLLDRTFKKAFNPDTQNKVCLIALLNAVLESEIAAPIVDVQSRNKEYSDGSNENRTSIFDLHCIDSKQRRFIIEVQIRKTNLLKKLLISPNFLKRTFSPSRLLSENRK